jgi:hypothetical protein
MPTLKIGGKRCQCASCERYCNSLNAFDRHRVGVHGKDRHCADPESLGMVKNEAGYWISERWERGVE